MRMLISAFLFLAACETGGETKAVDTAHLPPLSGREKALIMGAESAARQGNMDVAERDYQNAIAASAGNIDAHMGLARLYATNKQPEKERIILERAATLQPDHPLVTYLLGKRALNAQDYPTALAWFTRGLTRAPQDTDLLSGAGIASDMVGKHTAAQAFYTRALTAPGAALGLVRTNLAMSYLFSNQPAKAIPLLKDDAQKADASPVTRHNLALAYGLLGKTAEAKAALKGQNEPARLAALARMKDYHAAREEAMTPPATEVE